MADEADIAARTTDTHLSAAIANAKRPVGPDYSGECLSCNTPLDFPRRWCDAECRDHWQKEND